MLIGLGFWADGAPLIEPVLSTLGVAYWGDGAPIPELYCPTQYVYPSSIASAEAFGAEGVRQTIKPSSITSAETFGAPHLKLTIKPSSITTGEGFGNAAVNIITVLLPSSITSAEVVGDHEIIPGDVTISLNAPAEGELTGSWETGGFGDWFFLNGIFPSFPVEPGTIELNVSGTIYYDDGAGNIICPGELPPGSLTSGTVDYESGSVNLYSGAFSEPEQPYVNYDFSGGIYSQETVGTPLVAPTQRIQDFTWLKAWPATRGYIVTRVTDGIPAGYNPIWTYWNHTFCWVFFPDSGRDWIGRPAVMPGLLRLTVPEGIPEPDPFDEGIAFGTPELICGPVDVAPEGVVSAEAFGNAQLNLFVLPDGVDSAESLGTPSIVSLIRPTSITSEETVDDGAELLCGPVDIYPGEIVSREAVGEPLFGSGVRSIGIESEEAFGSVNVIQLVRPESILSAAQVGSPNVVQLVKPSGVSSEEQVSVPALVQFIRPGAIASGETVPLPAVVPGPVWIYPPAIETLELFGRTRVVPPKEPSNLIVLEVKYPEAMVLTEGLDYCDLYYEPLRMVINE